MTRAKIILDNDKNSSAYGRVTKLVFELEFQQKGNKQIKRGNFSAKSCDFIDRNRFRK